MLYLAVVVQAISNIPQNPAVLLLWFLGIPSGLAFLTLIVKGIFFVGKASSKLDLIDTLNEQFADHRHFVRDNANATQLSFTIIETDMNAVQAKTGLPVRAYPDRRVGPPDRRQASQ